MQYNAEQIGKRIKEERIKRGWKQGDLARKLDKNNRTISNKQISNYENGKLIPPLENLLDFCYIYDCELGYLLGEEEYSDRTRLDSIICQETGLNLDSLNTIRGLTRGSRLISKDSQRVLNTLLSGSLFPGFILKLCDVEIADKYYESIIKKLEDKLGADLLDKAMKAFMDPEFDYEHDVELQKLEPKLCEAIHEVDKSIDEVKGAQEMIDFARYHLNKEMEYLIDNIYPKSKYGIR